jgi:hypothetical protein
LKEKGLKNSRLTDERVRLLNDLKCVWNAQEAQWLEQYEDLVKFEEEHDHVCVPQQHRTKEGLALGLWVDTQHKEWKKKQKVKVVHNCLGGFRGGLKVGLNGLKKILM